MAAALSILVENFEHEPAVVSRTLRELRSSDYDTFLAHALEALRELPDSPGSAHLLRMVLTDNQALFRFTDPVSLPMVDAGRLALRMKAVDASVEARLLRLILPSEGPVHDPWHAARVLEIVAAIADAARPPALLPALLRHPDARIRSKVTLLVGRSNHSVLWLEKCLADRDPRIRANAVQALWGLDSPDARAIFLAAAADAHYRVAANGVVALYRAGDLEAIRLARAMAAHANPQFCAAAVWAMGETRDSRFLPVLAQLIAEHSGSVRRNALRASAAIRKQVETLRCGRPLRLAVSRSAAKLEIRVRTWDGGILSGLPSTAFLVTERDRFLEIRSVWQTGTGSSCYYEVCLAESPSGPVTVSAYSGASMGEREIP